MTHARLVHSPATTGSGVCRALSPNFRPKAHEVAGIRACGWVDEVRTCTHQQGYAGGVAGVLRNYGVHHMHTELELVCRNVSRTTSAGTVGARLPP